MTLFLPSFAVAIRKAMTLHQQNPRMFVRERGVCVVGFLVPWFCHFLSEK